MATDKYNVPLQRTTTNMSVMRQAAAVKPAHKSFFQALLATALFRCWNLMVFFGGWSTMVYLIHIKVHNISVNNVLLTVIGTVLGFVISYRTTSSFDRYNEGRKLWSQIVLASRLFARNVWFHIPELPPATPEDENRSEAERRARAIIEKKSAINLVEAFAVAVKHYLRGEQGIHYTDLYPLVKSLPPYALPAGLESRHLEEEEEEENSPSSANSTARTSDVTTEKRNAQANTGELPLPVTSPRSTRFNAPKTPIRERQEPHLLPAHNPPSYSVFDVFPFSLLVKFLTKRGKSVQGRKASRLRAKLGTVAENHTSHNVPLEITLYLSSYMAALNNRKSIDIATNNQLLAALNQLVDALTGLERILTTPIPWSYSVHLWVVTWLYCIALPFQVVQLLGSLTIPATVAASFIFFGFIVAGEEIENPFGYDKNDLDLDHFCHNIIRLELRAITAMPIPDPADWAFSPSNDALFDAANPVAPSDWVQRGVPAIRDAMTRYDIAPDNADS